VKQGWKKLGFLENVLGSRTLEVLEVFNVLKNKPKNLLHADSNNDSVHSVLS